jgi:hypothetical protein
MCGFWTSPFLDPFQRSTARANLWVSSLVPIVLKYKWNGSEIFARAVLGAFCMSKRSHSNCVTCSGKSGSVCSSSEITYVAVLAHGLADPEAQPAMGDGRPCPETTAVDVKNPFLGGGEPC